MMPRKVRLLALKTMLSARLAEGRIIVIDNCDIPEYKTRHIGRAIGNLSKRESYLLVTGNYDEDYMLACRNVDRLSYTTYHQVRISDILKHDKILFTLDGVMHMLKFLHERTVIRHKPRAIKIATPLCDSVVKERSKKKPQPEVGYD